MHRDLGPSSSTRMPVGDTRLYRRIWWTLLQGIYVLFCFTFYVSSWALDTRYIWSILIFWPSWLFLFQLVYAGYLQVYVEDVMLTYNSKISGYSISVASWPPAKYWSWRLRPDPFDSRWLCWVLRASKSACQHRLLHSKFESLQHHHFNSKTLFARIITTMSLESALLRNSEICSRLPACGLVSTSTCIPHWYLRQDIELLGTADPTPL